MIPNDNITDISVDKLVVNVDHGNARNPGSPTVHTASQVLTHQWATLPSSLSHRL